MCLGFAPFENMPHPFVQPIEVGACRRSLGSCGVGVSGLSVLPMSGLSSTLVPKRGVVGIVYGGRRGVQCGAG